MGNPIDKSTQTDSHHDTRYEILVHLYYARYRLRNLENNLSELQRSPVLTRSVILEMIDKARDDIHQSMAIKDYEIPYPK
jgi:hypothetical protein